MVRDVLKEGCAALLGTIVPKGGPRARPLCVAVACRRLWVQAQCGTWRPWVAMSDKEAACTAFPFTACRAGRPAVRLRRLATTTEGAGPPREGTGKPRLSTWAA